MYYNYKDLLEETRNKEFSFESLETADSYELFWLPEIDPYKKLEHQYGTPINPEELYYSFPKNLIPSISSHLEKEKNWEKLIELEKYQDLINELSEKFKGTTLKRINFAKENMA